MIAVYYNADAIFITGKPAYVAGSLTASASGDTVNIYNVNDLANAEVSASYTLLMKGDGSQFPSSSACVAYLNGQFYLPAQRGNIYSEPLTIVEQDIIPAISKPWADVPLGFANVIAGAVTLTNQSDGTGAVSFTNGSTQITYNPSHPSTGFNLNPGDDVVVQYSSFD